MSEDKFQESLRELREAMMEDFALNTYITGTLEGKTLRDLDVGQLMEELKGQWNKAMAELPEYIRRLQDGETLAARYRFAGQDRLLVGLTKAGPFMKIEPSFVIGYSPEVFENSTTVDALVDNHRKFYDISREMLGNAFQDIKGRIELEEGAIEFRRYLARSENGLVYRMKKGFAFALCNFFSHFLFKKSYGEVIIQAAMANREDIRAYDVLSRFFGGERDFVADSFRDERAVPNETGVREIGDLAKNLAHCYGRMRQEKVKKLQAYMLYAPAQF